jgi:von Willebrand factor type A domain-containing protein
MGLGRFKNGKFDLVVVANFAMSATDVTEWRRSFVKASELFWDASEGQVQYGKIFVCDESVGADTAEIILHPSGDPSYGTRGQFGVLGKALHLMPYVKFQPLTHHHEMGHHVWNLGEEYAGVPVLERIDTSVAPANNSTVPLVSSTYATGALVGADAILMFGANLERRRITANTATSLTVNPTFSQSPVNDSDGWVQYQFSAECSNVANSRYCIMEKSRGAAGTLDAAGVWTPAANPVIEFCSNSNHDPDVDTEQEKLNHDSCWETIVIRPGYTGLTAPDPASAGPSTGFTAPDWIVLDKQPRFAVMLDRSGSMSQGNKMADARHGAVYWLERCSVANDLLTLVSYDDQINTMLNLTQVSTLGSLGPTTNAINALTPRGATNIRDALFAARNQIESRPTRAAVQVGLLITDGIHNYPPGSSPREALEEYAEGGIRLYTLGVGQPGDVDMVVLNDLAKGTGGRSYAVGDNQPSVIEQAMIEISTEVRGGIITTQPVLFPDSKTSGIDDLIAPLLKQGEGSVPPKRRPPLDELLNAAGVTSLEDLLPGGKQTSDRIRVIPVDVESRADRASFNTVHPDSVDIWLYLVDPGGAAVDPTAGTIHHVESRSPHEFIVVDRPLPGRWLLVAVRVQPGPAFAGGLVAGGENRTLQAFASAPAQVPSGKAVIINASARWKHQLSDLAIQAVVTAPSGAQQMIGFDDNEPGRPNSGSYRGIYQPTEDGRHSALVTISGSSAATIADPVGRSSHSLNGLVDTDPSAPNFVRQIVVSFEVGEPPKSDPKPETPSKDGLERPRPRRLVSAKRVRLFKD